MEEFLVRSYSSKTGLYHIGHAEGKVFRTRCGRVIKNADVERKPMTGIRRCPKCGSDADYAALNEEMRARQAEKQAALQARHEARRAKMRKRNGLREGLMQRFVDHMTEMPEVEFMSFEDHKAGVKGKIVFIVEGEPFELEVSLLDSRGA